MKKIIEWCDPPPASTLKRKACITPVKCGHCKGYHSLAIDVRQCSLKKKQTSYAPTFGALEQRSPSVNTRSKKMTEQNWNTPNQRVSKVPVGLLIGLRDGYYAARVDSTHAYTFFRVSRPKSGRYAGAIKIQTQHGPDYKLALVRWEEDRVSVYNWTIEDALLVACIQQVNCAIAYAEEIGKCCRCNTELTDERSRWYGIGPECEKHWPEIIPEVGERRGHYEVGMS